MRLLRDARRVLRLNEEACRRLDQAIFVRVGLPMQTQVVANRDVSFVMGRLQVVQDGPVPRGGVVVWIPHELLAPGSR
eukprot:8839104-Pyramimonas_sp.AAC.1